MGVRADERGQAIQVGAIVLFAFLILSFAGYQAVLVPQQNAEVEFRHSQVVGDDMVELRTAIVEAWATGSPRSATVHLGTTYPSRIMAVNPAPPGGTLRTGSGGTITVEVTGTPSDGPQSICGSTSVSSRNLTYRGHYNEYADAPTVVYENTVVFRRYEDGLIFGSGQTLVQNQTVNIIALSPAYQESGGSAASVTAEPGSMTSESVPVNQNQNLTITFPSSLNASVWDDRLLDQQDQVANVERSGNEIEITLAGPQPGGNPPGNPQVDYTVNCRQIGLDRAP